MAFGDWLNLFFPQTPKAQAPTGPGSTGAGSSGGGFGGGGGGSWGDSGVTASPSGQVSNEAASVSGEVAPTPAPTVPKAAAPAVPDRSNSIALQNAGLSGAEQQRLAGLKAVQDALSSITGGYDTEAASNEGNYTTQTETNTNNLQRQIQAALVAAARGRQGLFGTLASLGALSGSGIDLANNAVQQGANADISGANDTFGENKTTLDTAIGSFRAADEARRKKAAIDAANASAGVENQAATNKQKFYSNLADDYTQMGNTTEAAKFAQLAAALFPQIANTSVQTPSSLTPVGAAYTPATLSNYLGGAGDTSVRVAPTAGGSGLPGLIAGPLSAPVRRREDTATV